MLGFALVSPFIHVFTHLALALRSSVEERASGQNASGETGPSRDSTPFIYSPAFSPIKSDFAFPPRWKRQSLVVNMQTQSLTSKSLLSLQKGSSLKPFTGASIAQLHLPVFCLNAEGSSYIIPRKGKTFVHTIVFS